MSALFKGAPDLALKQDPPLKDLADNAKILLRRHLDRDTVRSGERECIYVRGGAGAEQSLARAGTRHGWAARGEGRRAG